MPIRSVCLTAIVLAALGLGAVLVAGEAARRWAVHDPDRPRPPAIDPGTASTQDRPGRPPSDAIVLFDGGDLSQWVPERGGTMTWTVRDGAMVVGKGSIRTRQGFGDCQLHVEWMTPDPPRGTGQDRGNSGVLLMGRYEVQILDSFQADTYADGMAGAIYGQNPPLVNALRPPGQWQTYDIVFRRPRFSADGRVLRPARMTVFHNGVLVQDNFELRGATAHKVEATYRVHGDSLPLALQDHAHPVRFRNIWIRPLEED